MEEMIGAFTKKEFLKHITNLATRTVDENIESIRNSEKVRVSINFKLFPKDKKGKLKIIN